MNAIATTVPRFSDPCFEWGVTGTSMHRQVTPDSPCRVSGATSETKRQAVVRLLLVPGGLLAGCALGIFGVVRRRPLAAVAGAAVVYAASMPFMLSLANVAALASGAYLLAARPLTGAAKIIARALGTVAALFALTWIHLLAAAAGWG